MFCWFIFIQFEMESTRHNSSLLQTLKFTRAVGIWAPCPRALWSTIFSEWGGLFMFLTQIFPVDIRTSTGLLSQVYFSELWSLPQCRIYLQFQHIMPKIFFFSHQGIQTSLLNSYIYPSLSFYTLVFHMLPLGTSNICFLSLPQRPTRHSLK